MSKCAQTHLQQSGISKLFPNPRFKSRERGPEGREECRKEKEKEGSGMEENEDRPHIIFGLKLH